ncbi:LuxR C-terminal-related transcriptional regulator [Colwellia sp. 4_MG-2023]|uniref:LuxR C-terminal-related transcriptional regulator n=1 Tax=unclassified Colwellia TaxID=196834 RepID=UPI001C09E0C8|nr:MULTISPECIES: LuxR C-terminal-related transcriptional regulator [unclassified Colwellia]MBU2924898.1 LuxR C-terminal-related transcriptional regulator [Colwellia sp. C2M11]MDO6506797.1 LuxR C-terminal-related transcriptional regulator [Colwellia sp. 5_MG-2023]MDO6555828.1 LuxR C-terminal-related transcriptional regulator [Colwellia sp. 4_MG-2023]MDO6652872.1 LuxR C-terminal-related transcriptional regulator [Colwellia sp. 3_MG-2023]MDO6665874.1 LuxR C-terminal-related transcriptional regula
MKTKFITPISRSKMMNRHKLLKSSKNKREPKLTLVAAPAGFGKTTLLTQSRESLLSDGYLVPWISLGADDCSVSNLLRNIVEAIQYAIPTFGARTARIISACARLDVTRTLSDLVEDIRDTEAPLILILDDYHCVSGGETDELIELLLNLAPENFQMIVASRTRPQFGLAALRVRDELREITPTQLRFDLSEASEFLLEIRNLGLNDDQIEKIHQHSEGWVAGLQLASLSLRDPERRDGFIESFSGSLQDIAEYLASDVLNQQPKAVQEFLLRTSVSNRINGELAAYLTGNDNAPTMLEEIERDGLFVSPLDQNRTWYRYHQLFHEFLLAELRRRHPGELVCLYRKTAIWFQKQNLSREAVEYALLAGDFNIVTTLVEQQSWIELMAGRMPQVITSIRRIPDDVRNENPKILYLLGTALYHANSADESDDVLSKMISLVDKQEASAASDESKYLSEQTRLLSAGIAIARDDPHKIIELLSDEFYYLSDFERGLACNFLGYALSELGEFGPAAKTLSDGRHYHLLAGSEFGAIYSECFLALTDFSNGNLDHCFARFSPESRSFSKEKYVAPIPQVIQGIVLYQWNRIDEALECLQPNLPLIGEVGFTKLLVFGYTALARISGLHGDHRAAMRCYDLIAAVGARWGAPYERHQALVVGARIAYLLQAERLNEALDHALINDIDVDADTLSLPAEWARKPCRNALTWARLQIATGRPEVTLPVLAELRKLATESRWGMRVLECYILEARARFLQDKIKARSLVDEALAIAAPNHSVRCFVDEGSEIDSLLLDLRQSEIKGWSSSKRSFLEDVTLSIVTEESEEAEVTNNISPVAGLIEPLSDRECQILGLISAGCTNNTISTTLFISLNTVKWHLKNIFGKLGVNNRTSAVAVARQLDLIPM